MKAESIVFESCQDAASMRLFLQALMDGLEKEELSFTSEGKSITVHPKGLLDCTLQAEQTSERCALTLSVAWHTDAEK